MRIQSQREAFAVWREGAATYHPGQVQMPIALAKQYLVHNGPETHYPDGRPVEDDLQQSNRDYMDKMKETLATQGWEGFENYPAFTVGAGGRHAIMEDGNHRVHAADALGMTHVPVNLTTGENPDWAKQYGKRVTPELRQFLRQSTGGAAMTRIPLPEDLARSEQVFPTASQTNGTDVRRGDTELLGERLIGEWTSSDQPHVGFGQGGPRTRVSNHRPASVVHVLDVLGLTTEQQMNGLHANRSITGVPDEVARRNGSAKLSVGSLMCFDVPLSPLGRHAELPVAISVGGCRPIPAPLRRRRGDRWLPGHEPGKGLVFVESTGAHAFHCIWGRDD